MTTGPSASSSSVADPAGQRTFKVAYLVNQYPAVSHSFIRREIIALEGHGFAIERFSIRPASSDLVDPADLAEKEKTHVLLSVGLFGLFAAALSTAIARPTQWLTALAAAVRQGRRSQDRGVFRHLAYLAEACVLLRRLRAAGDVVHVHAHFGTNSATVAMLTRILGGPKYSFTVHGPKEFDQPVGLSLAEKIKEASAVVAVSNFGRSQLYRWIPHEQWPKVHVVRCGVDQSFLAAGPQPISDNRRLVCVGRLTEQKGQLLIVDAIGILAREGLPFELVLVGDGPMRGAVEKRLRDLGLEGRVRITGWASNAAVRSELLAARIVLMPSFAEGLPVALMEALALGRPAVATYIAGIPELIEDRVNGWLIAAGSAENIATAVREALKTSPETLRAMGQAGAAAVAQKHDVVREAARLADVFRGAKTQAY